MGYVWMIKMMNIQQFLLSLEVHTVVGDELLSLVIMFCDLKVLSLLLFFSSMFIKSILIILMSNMSVLDEFGMSKS